MRHYFFLATSKVWNILSFQSNGNSCDVAETGKSSPQISNGKPENGIRSPDSTKLTSSVNGGQDGSTDRGGSLSPVCRSNGDRSRDSPLTTCDDGNDDVSTPTPCVVPLHQQMSAINLQDDQHQQPTATIHGVQVNGNEELYCVIFIVIFKFSRKLKM